MDSVLNALRHYRQTVSPQKKADDLARLEKCLSNIDADQYVYAVMIQTQQFSMQQNKFINHNLNPDYNLDFSLYIKYGNTCCICI